MKHDNQKIINNQVYISDLALAATLSLSGFEITSLEKRDSKRVFFVFQAETKIVQTIQDFWQGKLKVEPQQFFNQIKNLKSRIYSAI